MEPVISSRAHMGSPFSINAFPDSRVQRRERLDQVIEFAHAEIARVEDLLTDFRPSPFNDINDNAGIRPVKVSHEILTLIDFARRISDETGGAFDISYAAVGALWRTAFTTGKPPTPAAIAAARRFVNYRAIQIDADASAVFLPEKGMRIGLGSIGKSYGVDMAFTLMRGLKIKNFFINGAGDMRVHTAADAPRPWRIGIKNPFRSDDKPCGVLDISRGAVATSGDYERYFEHGGKRYHHIIDARTAAVRDDVSSVTVLAPTAVIANAYATAVMALGATEGAVFLEGRRDANGMIITSDGRVIQCNIDEHAITMATGGTVNASS
ncbi:MAG: FAD:protein FMN transferase [Elusimicrobia bacterium]|nr:FAD:protein FMN transferase [Elusimicrobiota bacterium]